MTKPILKTYSNAQKTAEAFGDYLVEKAMEKSTDFHCALSGGSTPKILFEYLASKYPNSPVWKKIHFYWGDERCVPPNDSDSNYKMTEEFLLSKVSIPESNIHRVQGENAPGTEAERYGSVILNHIPPAHRWPSFDMIILGMGGDGHTASIFPHQMELLISEQICEVATHPESGQNRVTLTGNVINAAKEIAFLVTGDGKKEKIKEILKKTGDFEKYPAAHISPDDGVLMWYMDEAAASLLA